MAAADWVSKNFFVKTGGQSKYYIECICVEVAVTQSDHQPVVQGLLARDIHVVCH